MATDKRKVEVPNAIKFLFGGISGMGAACFTQPLDLVKNRMQVSVGKEHKTSAHVVRHIIKSEGALALYSGLSAGLMRQATYTTTRLGIYTYLFERFSGPNGESPNFLKKAGMGMVAGIVGSFIGTPTEVSLIRMTSDGRLPLSERRNYKNVFDAVFRIAREEGMFTLWRGAVPTMSRAMVVNAAQLSSYSQSKEALLSTGYLNDNIFLHFWASMVSGFVTTVASMPVDIAKTRIQNMKIIDGKPEYKGTFDVLGKVIRNEGVFSLWKGFTPYYMRLGPHTVIVFVLLEQLNSFYKWYALSKKPMFNVNL